MTRESLGECLKVAGLAVAIITIILLSVGCTTGTHNISSVIPLPDGQYATLMVNTEWNEDLIIFVVRVNDSVSERIGVARSPIKDGKVVIYLHCWFLPSWDSVQLVATNLNEDIIMRTEHIYLPDATSWTWNITDWNRSYRVKKGSTRCRN